MDLDLKLLFVMTVSLMRLTMVFRRMNSSLYVGVDVNFSSVVLLLISCGFLLNSLIMNGEAGKESRFLMDGIAVN